MNTLLFVLLEFSALVTIAMAASQSQSLRAFYENNCQQQIASKDLVDGSSWSCTVVELPIDRISPQSLSSILESKVFLLQHEAYRKQYSHYYVVITITEASANYTSAYESIDLFLTTRPWWIVRQYPTKFQLQSDPSASDTAEQPILWNHNPLLAHEELILERVPEFVESIGKGSIAQSFPVDCSRRTFYIKTSIGSWGNDIVVNMRGFLMRSFEAVHMMYISRTGSVHDGCGFVEPLATPQCANQVNKHLCAFLPISNCTVPSTLRSCQEVRCIKEGYYIPSADGTDHTYEAQHSANLEKWDTYFPANYPWTVPSQENLQLRIGKDLHAGVVNGNIERLKRHLDAEMSALTLMFNWIYRLNYELGLHVQSVMESFFEPLPSHSSVAFNASGTVKANQRDSLPIQYAMDRSVRCHAAHMRLGDRYINRSVDMFDWCRAHTNVSAKYPDERFMGAWIDGRPLVRGQWYNMGCNRRLPFGTLSLQHFVNASYTMNPNITHLVIMTDDYDWLDAELEIFQARGAYRDLIHLHILPIRKKNIHRTRQTYQGAAQWWGGIQTARHCEGFIGHEGSAATLSYYYAMCFQHRQHFWKCPPFFTFD